MHPRTVFTWCLLLLMFSACRTPHAESLGELDNDADSVHTNGKSALMLAARDRNLNRVEWLLQQGADVNKVNNNGGTPIMYAVLGGDIRIVRMFVDQGADLNARAKNGWSAIMIAAAKGYTEITRELLAHAANPNLADVYGWSPLMRAVYEDRESVVKLLVQNPETDINHIGENGITSLHIATVQGNLKLAATLLNNGADRTIRDESGRTPYEIARFNKEAELQDLLKIE